MSDTSRNGGDFPDIPDCLKSDPPALAPLPPDATDREMAVRYATIATHLHGQQIAIVEWMRRSCACWILIEQRTAKTERAAAAPPGVPFAAFLAVCAIAGFLIGVVVLLAIRHG